MKMQFWSVGKQHDQLFKEAIEEFTGRINKYFDCQWKIIPPVKNSSSLHPDELKKQEGKAIFSQLQKEDFLVLLDERGKSINNDALAKFIQDKANGGMKKLVFLIGGSYGTDEMIIKRANLIWSLSKLVFPHMLARLILSEQVYRSCTIIKNEKYHHS